MWEMEWIHQILFQRWKWEEFEEYPQNDGVSFVDISHPGRAKGAGELGGELGAGWADDMDGELQTKNLARCWELCDAKMYTHKEKL